ncbi:MAG TPA: TetR/AcrR family transcriptional regulator [Solirubrobacteraceae bacterium]|nr:TetR/AcrR family transcriptional regulator [Solirubrobacteraceae bacterium]
MAASAAGSVARARPARGRAVVDALPGERVAQLQRARLLRAAVVAFDELGYVGTSVADVTSRARVSRRTFYEQFANSDDCLAVLFDDVVAAVERELAAVGLAGRAWCERVRMGLWRILVLLDREPVLARVCVVQAARGGPLLAERRERLAARLAAVVDEGREECRVGIGPSPLTAEGVVGAALSIVQARLARREPLVGLLNELVGMVVLPYRGAAAARRELRRAVPEVGVAEAAGAVAGGLGGVAAADPLVGLRMRLTYRTTRVLEGVAGWPGASNRQIAARAGVQDPGQISKLLIRLQGLGLLANTGVGHARGEPNAWRLTPLGERLIDQLRLTSANNACAVPSGASTHEPEEEK